MWLDCTALGLSQSQLIERLDRAKIWLSSGTDFGRAGEGFFRMNIACQRSVVETAMQRLEAAFGTY